MLFYLLEWLFCLDVHISIYAHMCEMNMKDIYSCVHVYMQTGMYVHVCANMYTCMEVFICLWMMLVCGCMNALAHKCICVFDRMCICMC